MLTENFFGKMRFINSISTHSFFFKYSGDQIKFLPGLFQRGSPVNDVAKMNDQRNIF